MRLEYRIWFKEKNSRFIRRWSEGEGEGEAFLVFAKSVATYKYLEAFLEDIFVKFGDITYSAGKPRWLQNVYPVKKSVANNQENVPESKRNSMKNL